ncbi:MULTISPECIES: FHA domain-containing protein [unclassified Adlercreutzia]|uniref:FHA domain-containing protein n=1 Tax=unclassified Adlercreutzia TaxID=2636013 RepID=UPI00197F8C9C|nr:MULTISPECIES: FHA domain-containing protein [unclassified Adlercreutzia]
MTTGTPISVLFSLMKKQGGISNKELAGLILSGRPLSDGRSAKSRIDDRTWVSRFLVHAAADDLSDQYFCDYAVGALRIVARMKSRGRRTLSGSQVLEIVCGPDGRAMDDALRACGRDPTLYRNMLERIVGENALCVDERAEAAMVLLVTAACTADVRRAVDHAQQFVQTTYGGGLSTPRMALASQGEGEASARGEDEAATAPAPVLGLLRVKDGLVVGAPHWLSSAPEGSEVGALALSDGAVNEVEADVSARHARIWRSGEDVWYVEDLGSRNGTVLVSGLSGDRVEVRPPCEGCGSAASAVGQMSAPVPVRPGDQLRFGASTTFIVIEGMPSS